MSNLIVDEEKMVSVMKERGLSGRALAKKAGVATLTVWRVLHGHGCNCDTLGYISRALEADPSEIVDRGRLRVSEDGGLDEYAVRMEMARQCMSVDKLIRETRLIPRDIHRAIAGIRTSDYVESRIASVLGVDVEQLR